MSKSSGKTRSSRTNNSQQAVVRRKLESALNQLTEDQRQLLADTIKYGLWGDTEYEFMENGQITTVPCDVYITNDARRGGNFSGRQISAMFRSIYSKLAPPSQNGAGEIIAHTSDWWGDGSGDVLFVREEYCKEIEEWGRNYKRK